MPSALTSKFSKYPSELIDFSLFLLLLFAENYLRMIFPKNLFDTQVEDMTAISGWLLMIAGGLGIFTFFRKPEMVHTAIENLSLSAGIGRIFSYLGGLFIAGLLCFMVVFGFIELGSAYAPHEGTALYNFFMFIFFFMILGFLIAPWYLISHYGENYAQLKYMHPSLRYLCLLPAIFLTASFMNQATAEVFSYNSYGEEKNGWEFLFSSFFSFVMCAVSPRLFATGERLEWKGWMFWLARFALYFFGLYFDF